MAGRNMNKEQYKKIDSVIKLSTFLALIGAVVIGITGVWIGSDINRWQMLNLTKSTRYYPMLTIAVLLVPVLAVLLPVKIWIKRRIDA